MCIDRTHQQLQLIRVNFIYFDEQGTAREQSLECRVTWTGFVMVAFRPYRDSLQAAFKSVFADLGLPWVPKRSLTVAVLLALGGGILGLHHFYMGHTRRGLQYLGFFWTAVPILLGWIDAVRLARLDDAGFQRRLAAGLPSGRPDPVVGPGTAVADDAPSPGRSESCRIE